MPAADIRAIATAAPDREKVPRILVRLIGAMLLLILALVSLARFSGMPPAASPPTGVPVLAERKVQIWGSITGEARVLDAHGTLIADLGPHEGGFVAGVWRALALKRRQAGIDPAAPVTLTRYADGRIQLRDPFTGWRAELIGFGATNREAFARLLR